MSRLPGSRLSIRAAVAAVLTLGVSLTAATSREWARDEKGWVTIWGTMPQLTEPANLPPAPYNQTGLVFDNSTVRQTVMVTLDASTIRLEISNVFGGSDLPVTAVTVAMPSTQKAGIPTIETSSLKTLTFSGSESIIVPNGAEVLSDPFEFAVKSRSIVTITMYLAKGQTTNSITSHPGSRTTTYMAHGNQVNAANLTDAASVAHWYFISSIEGYLDKGASALVIVGDSITDGRGSTTDGNDRWPDQLLARMQNDSSTQNIAIVNQAAGGNRILADGLGPNALGRIDRDVVAQAGVKYAIIYEGVNDIGTGATDAATQKVVGDRVIAAYEQMIVRLHRFGIAVFGGTITPLSGPGQGYSDPEREKTRQRVNEWIRSSGRFDAVIDFDNAVRNPDQVDQLAEPYNTGDYLHLNPTGYRRMAETVDLALFKKFEAGVSSMTKM